MLPTALTRRFLKSSRGRCSGVTDKNNMRLPTGSVVRFYLIRNKEGTTIGSLSLSQLSPLFPSSCLIPTSVTHHRDFHHWSAVPFVA